jgi:RNA polymerase sigma-70 factor (ECF subfamily)
MTREADVPPVPFNGPAGEETGEPWKGKLFLRLFLQNQRRLYAYVLTLLPNRTDADDVFQEASLVLWDKFNAENPPADFAAWGCRIAYFKVLDFCKK